MNTDEPILTAREKIANAYAGIFAIQRLENAIKEAFAQGFIGNPVASVQTFIRIKNGEKAGAGVPAEQVALYENAAIGELLGYITTAKDNAFDLMKITEKERFIHATAAHNYEQAVRDYEQADNAEKMLKAWRENPREMTGAELFVEALPEKEETEEVATKTGAELFAKASEVTK